MKQCVRGNDICPDNCCLHTMQRPAPHVTVYVLFREISDQYGTSEAVGVYSTQAAAENAARGCRLRTYIRAMLLDGVLSC